MDAKLRDGKDGGRRDARLRGGTATSLKGGGRREGEYETDTASIHIL